MFNPHLATRIRRAARAFTKPVRTPSYETIEVTVHDSASPELQVWLDRIEAAKNPA